MSDKNLLKKRILIVLGGIAAAILVFHLCFKEKTLSTAVALEESDILLTVNKEELYVSELNKMKEQYPAMSDKELIEGMILEALILEEAEKRNIQVTEAEVIERLELLKLENHNLYEIAIKQYESEENYKKALKYRMQYEKTKEEVVKEFTEFYWEEDRIMEDTLAYIKKNKYDSNNENISNISAAYTDNYLKYMKAAAFYKYNYDLTKEAVIKYKSFIPVKLFVSAFDGRNKIKQGYTLKEVDKEIAKDMYSCLVNFGTGIYNGQYSLYKVYGITQSTSYFNYLMLQYKNHKSGNEITVEFVLDSGNQYGLMDMEQSANRLPTGFYGFYSEEESAYYIFDKDINGIYIISSKNLNEKALENFAEQVIKYTKSQSLVQ
ncbi:hypothetical protein acsn021_24900 [Anaerocolumna cellulosilytica]|uniref:Uncharacterized protein n=1 Tax=Anaerocolumna cellulosilytica TaxID=433286 RepID=A0A6S6R7I3_9FIRM|nr:hypothetical protein [Anaerocolumna cellulosilytica]MBB5193863.1 hypothetical protein [Anaerocolumna cellulosilytica]BCJ94921.1 hypothetical protein acsn021_24900 [Anaerocolumna cellulosilytica]